MLIIIVFVAAWARVSTSYVRSGSSIGSFSAES
jgi:hypothetical protein